MKFIKESGVAYVLKTSKVGEVGHIQIGEGDVDIITQGEGVLYITGNDIYFGRRGRWYHISIDDINIVREEEGGRLSLVLSFTVPDGKHLEITLEGGNHAHMRAISHILSIYTTMKGHPLEVGEGGGINAC